MNRPMQWRMALFRRLAPEVCLEFLAEGELDTTARLLVPLTHVDMYQDGSAISRSMSQGRAIANAIPGDCALKLVRIGLAHLSLRRASSSSPSSVARLRCLGGSGVRRWLHL